MSTKSFEVTMTIDNEEQLSNLGKAVADAMNRENDENGSDVFDRLDNSEMRLKELHKL